MTGIPRTDRPRRTTNQSAGARNSATARQCPTCGRKSALIRWDNGPYDRGTACRWDDCGYAKDRSITV